MAMVRTSDLIGVALDYAVAEAIGWIEPVFGVGAVRYVPEDKYLMMCQPDPNEPDYTSEPHHFNHYKQWSPSRLWSQGGPLIESVQVEMARCSLSEWRAMAAGSTNVSSVFFGPTPLIAACRAIVASELGDTVDIPDELMPPL